LKDYVKKNGITCPEVIHSTDLVFTSSGYTALAEATQAWIHKYHPVYQFQSADHVSREFFREFGRTDEFGYPLYSRESFNEEWIFWQIEEYLGVLKVALRDGHLREPLSWNVIRPLFELVVPDILSIEWYCQP